jgi:hypothetical protein
MTNKNTKIILFSKQPLLQLTVLAAPASSISTDGATVVTQAEAVFSTSQKFHEEQHMLSNHEDIPFTQHTDMHRQDT